MGASIFSFPLRYYEAYNNISDIVLILYFHFSHKVSTLNTAPYVFVFTRDYHHNRRCSRFVLTKMVSFTKGKNVIFKYDTNYLLHTFFSACNRFCFFGSNILVFSKPDMMHCAEHYNIFDDG